MTNTTTMKAVLSIAGSDCSGGAGIQADLKTFTAHKVYGMSVITALTAQNTLGVSSIHNIPISMISDQLDAVFTDIYPNATKIGMVSQKEIICLLAEKLRSYNSPNIVLDPVMISTSGHRLLDEDAITALITELFPLATIITPNIPEAEVLCGFPINTKESLYKAFTVISHMTPAHILIKGGHRLEDCCDYLYSDGEIIEFPSERLSNTNTHGTGCTLSSAIASHLAQGKSIAESVGLSKQYVFDAINANLNLGSGHGPINHCVHL